MGPTPTHHQLCEPTGHLTLSLSPDQEHAKIHARHEIFHEVNKTNDGENFPNYPIDFNRGVQGPNALVADYGDVIRNYFSCAEPYHGPGCAVCKSLNYQ